MDEWCPSRLPAYASIIPAAATFPPGLKAFISLVHELRPSRSCRQNLAPLLPDSGRSPILERATYDGGSHHDRPLLRTHPNGQKIILFLEEAQLAYRLIPGRYQ